MRYLRTLFPAFLALSFSGLGTGCRNSPPAESAVHAEGPSPPSTALLRLSEEAVRTGGIFAEPARIVEMVRRLAAVGELEFNGRRLALLTARTAGRIERLTAFRGERAAEGQVLAEIYSQDYLALQAEVIQASERSARLQATPDGRAAVAFFQAARAKLIPMGISEPDIDDLVTTKSIRPLLPVRAPFSGRIIEQSAVVGDTVDPGSHLFLLADLTTLWAVVRITEKDLAAVRPGVEVSLLSQAFPGEEFRGRLATIAAVMDEKTRTVEARVEVANPEERLKPGMYVEASIAAGEKGKELVIPEAALQDLESKPVVFLQTGPGTYELRLVETGARSGGFVEILRGLAEGDEVVTSGSFLLKSEMLKTTMGEEHEHD
jgi:multidrug efflux pump subunit AcrA (membrane-fusion protein)